VVRDLDETSVNSYLLGLDTDWNQSIIAKRPVGGFPRRFCGYELEDTVIVKFVPITPASECDGDMLPIGADHEQMVKPSGRGQEPYGWAKSHLLEVDGEVDPRGDATSGRDLALARARQYFADKRYGDALNQLKKVAQDNYEGLILRGRIYLTLGKEQDLPVYYQQAEQVLDEAAKIDPNDGNAWHSLGFARFKLGKFDQARDAFLKAIALGTDMLATRYMLGFAYYKLGDIGHSETEWRNLAMRQTLSASEKYFTARAQLALAYVFSKKRESDAALESIDKFLREASAVGDRSDTLVMLTQLCMDMRSAAEPVSWLRMAAVNKIIVKHGEQQC
jgi:tetratricopeptide (TPR) repeat protein